MKKKKSSKNKKISGNYHSKIEEEPKEEIPKQTGVYHDFLVFEKSEKSDKCLYFEKCQNENPFLNDWIILQSKPKSNKSRFADLFQEIMENDRKALLEEQNHKKNNISEQSQKNNINEIDNLKQNINIININDNNNIYNFNNNFNNNSNNGISNNIFLKNNDININLNNNINNSNNNIINNNINLINNINLEPINEVEGGINYLNTNLIYNNNNMFIKEEKMPELISNSSRHTNLSKKSSKHKNSIHSNSSSNIGVSTNDSDYFGSLLSSSNNLISIERNSIIEKNSQLIVDIKRIIFLEDRRTSIMIKNIPNKFTGELLLNIIDQNFKGAYNIFILPTDNNKYKNFGYAFINFTNSYYIPYFYFLFNGKMWSSTNSQKVCEITYSKIQGKKGLISHYQGKIIFQNDSIKNNSELKFIMPNDYKLLFKQFFPKQYIEEYKYYFITKLPNKY